MSGKFKYWARIQHRNYLNIRYLHLCIYSVFNELSDSKTEKTLVFW